MERITKSSRKEQKFSTSATEIVERCRITEVADALGIRLDPSRRRGVASWRNGEHFSVSLSDNKGTWFDHAANEGGGVLDLVARVTGHDRRASLEWLASYAGVQIERRSLSPEEQKAVARERIESKRIRREAEYFADAAMLMAERELEELPSNDPARANFTSLIAGLRASPEAEYRAWMRHDPRMAAALVHAGRARRKRLFQALARWIAAQGEVKRVAA